jgi:hypothetical protein
MTAMISVIGCGSVISAQRFVTGAIGNAARIKAVEGARYVLESQTWPSAAEIKVTRFGDSLALQHKADGSAPASLVIEDFYAYRGQLQGLGVDGRYADYQAITATGHVTVADMDDGATSIISLRVASSEVTLTTFDNTDGSDAVIGSAMLAVPAIVAGLSRGTAEGVAADDQLETSSGANNRAVEEVSAASYGCRQEPAVGGSMASDDVIALDNPDAAAAGPVANPATSAELASKRWIRAEFNAQTSGSAAGFSADDTPVIDAILDGEGAIQGMVEKGGYTDDGRPTIVGKADPGVLVYIYRGVELIGEAVSNANGEWAFRPNLPFFDGRHVLSIIHEYPDGDVSDFSDPYVIFVDRTAPEAPLVVAMHDDQGRITGSISDGMITDDDRPTIVGSAEAHVTVIVYDKGREIGRTVVDADGKWSFTPDSGLADGLHILSYAAVDRAGNASERTGLSEFFVDTRPEKVNIYYAEDDVGGVIDEVFSGGTTDDSRPTLFGTATAGGIVNIYEGSVLLGQAASDVDGTWQFTPDDPLNEGLHSFHATVTLVAKGESERSRLFNLTVDVTAPERPSIEQVMDDVGMLQGRLESGAITDDNMPTLLGKAEASSTVHIHSNGVRLGSVVVDASGSWMYTPDAALVDGRHVLSVAAEDAAGNLSEFSEVFEIVVGTVPGATPTIDRVYDDAGSKTGSLAMGEVTDDSRPDISGMAEAGSTVIIRDYGNEIGRVLAGADGVWMFTPQLNLEEGAHGLTAESMDAAGNLSVPSDRFDFVVAQNGDDNPRVLVPAETNFNMIVVVDDSSSMAGAPIRSVQAALRRLAAECLDSDGGQTVTLTLLSMNNNTPVTYTFSSEEDADYVRYIAAVSSLYANGGPSYDKTIQAAANSIKAQHLAGDGPSQVFILGDTGNSLSQVVAESWQAMLLNPTGGAVLGTPIISSPICVTPFYPGYEYSFHWLATGGKAIDVPSPEMVPDMLLGSLIGDSISGNLLDNDVKLTRDGNEYLTQITLDGGLFHIAPNNSLVMTNVRAEVKGVYEPETGLLSITTESGTLQVHMYATSVHHAGDYTYRSRFVQLYHGESPKNETFGYMALDTTGASQSANLHIVLEPSDARNLLNIDTFGKDTGLQGDFLTADGTAGREVSGTLSQHLASGLKVQVSVDDGKTWLDAVTHGKNWTFLDMSRHSSSWKIQVRVSDGVTHGTLVLAQDVTLIEAPAAPVIVRIPEAENIYTSVSAKDGSEMTVSLTATSAKAGDNVHIQWGTSTYDQVLTPLNISNGYVILNIPAAVTYSTASYNYDFEITARIISRDGALGAPSAPYSVVGTYTRALLSDALQLAPVDDVYAGNGFIITTTGSLTKTAATISSLAGLTLIDPVQANATFTLSKPADQIVLRLSGAENALGVQIRVFDVDGNILHQQAVFGDATARHVAIFNWSKSGLADIGSFTVVAMSASVTLDSFSQYVATHAADERDRNLIDILTETFYGSGADDIVSMSQYAQTYFGQAAAAVHGGAGTDTLKLLGTNHVLDLTAAGAKISSVEVIDLTGSGNNVLTLNLSDVLRNGGTDIFHAGDAARVQMMVKGNPGDRVNLSDLLVGGVDHGDWMKGAAIVIDGVIYEAFQHSSLAAELLVQQGVSVSVSNSTAVGAGAFSVAAVAVGVSDVLVTADEELFASSMSPCERNVTVVNDFYPNPGYGSALDTQDYQLEAC